MTTLKEAQAAVRSTLDRDSARRHLVIGDDCLEDHRGYLVEYGPPAWVREADPRAMPLDLPAALVDKTTGTVAFVNYLDNASRIDAMTPAAP